MSDLAGKLREALDAVQDATSWLASGDIEQTAAAVEEAKWTLNEVEEMILKLDADKEGDHG